MKLTEHNIRFLQLMLRSPDVGEGWRNVSSVLWQLVDKFDRPELVEKERHEDGSGRVRLTERGKVLVDYI